MNRSRGRSVAGWLAIAAFGLVIAGPSVGAVPVPGASGCSPGLGLTAHPTAGAAPLVAEFQLTVLGSAPTSIAWSFGDGSYFNGSTSAFFSPIHRFDHAGTYSTTVVVDQGTQVSSCTVTLAVSAGRLQTLATVVPKAGVAPLTVQFTATVLGGSGTFQSATWAFGNGQVGSGFNLSYTYPAPGDYVATFHVTDSSNASSNSTLFVNVTAPASVRSDGLTGSWLSWVTGFVLAAGVGIVGMVLYARSYYGERGARGDRSPAAQFVPPSAVLEPPSPHPVPSVESRYAPTSPVGPGPVAPTPRPVPIPRVAPRIEPALPPLPAPSAPAGAPEHVERLRLSQRVVLHIYTLGTLRDDEIAPPSFTQAGMSERLAVGQSPLSNVLRRLVIAGVLTQDVRHVRGRPRRLRVYRLTPMGESLALELRRQRETGRPPAN